MSRRRSSARGARGERHDPLRAGRRQAESLSHFVFAALGDPTRLAIVRRLCYEGPLSISRLAAGGSLTRQAITKHLGVMERARILRSEGRGRERLWRIEQARLAEARHYLDVIAKQWDGALGRLKAMVEG